MHVFRNVVKKFSFAFLPEDPDTMISDSVRDLAGPTDVENELEACLSV